MLKYYRTSDMLNLIIYFPEISPIKNLTIIENEKDFLQNKDYIKTLDSNRVDSLKGKKIVEIENAGRKEEFFDTLKKVKEKDPEGVLVLFNVDCGNSERYERYAGISVLVDVLDCVYIDAVGKGFDGREVSKGICTHERYQIPWFKLRNCSVSNFKEFQTFQISQEAYIDSRNERVQFLKSIGLDEAVFGEALPDEYESIPDFIWQHVIEGILKKLEKMEDELISGGFEHFAISGHTEGKKFTPWQMFDKSRYSLKK